MSRHHACRLCPPLAGAGTKARAPHGTHALVRCTRRGPAVCGGNVDSALRCQIPTPTEALARDWCRSRMLHRAGHPQLTLGLDGSSAGARRKAGQQHPGTALISNGCVAHACLQARRGSAPAAPVRWIGYNDGNGANLLRTLHNLQVDNACATHGPDDAVQGARRRRALASTSSRVSDGEASDGAVSRAEAAPALGAVTSICIHRAETLRWLVCAFAALTTRPHARASVVCNLEAVAQPARQPTP